MNPSNQQLNRIATEYDTFQKDVASLSSDYGESDINKYLTMFRARITSQIAIQLDVIERDDFGDGKMLSLGGWPGVALIILNRLTGISGTLLDHPALLTETMERFYKDHGFETVEFDFANAANSQMPLSGQFQVIECCQCIEHWNFSPIPVFRQIFANLLAPNGSLLVTVPNATSLYRRLAALVGKSPYPAMQAFIDVDRENPGAEVSPHWREYTTNDLKMLMEYCGGHCTELRTASYAIAGNNSLSHRFYSLFNNLHSKFKENAEVVCKKA